MVKELIIHCIYICTCLRRKLHLRKIGICKNIWNHIYNIHLHSIKHKTKGNRRNNTDLTVLKDKLLDQTLYKLTIMINYMFIV